MKAVPTGILLLALGIQSSIAAADLLQTFEFDIAPQPLNAALLQYSAQSGVQVTSRATILDGKSSSGVTGTFPARNALEKLLAGTELGYDVIDPRTVVIRPATNDASSAADDQAETAPDQRRSFWDRFRLAEVDRGSAAGNDSVAEPETASGQPVVLEEIVVSAQKRMERLYDVPVPITAIPADSLVSSGRLRIQDYYSSVPGFSVSAAPGSGNEQVLSIRGITTGFGTNPTVGVTVDDIPYGSSTGTAGNIVPDIDPSDLAHIEVLRGPQGALYGSSSMGGLLKFVTIDPSMDGVTGRLQVGTLVVHDGSDPGYHVRGAVNVPLSDTIAIRASGFTRRDPGYIDNPILPKDDINRADVYGGHAAALWKPSDAFSLKLNALYQDTQGDGLNYAYVLPGLGDLQANDLLQNADFYERRVQVYSAVVNGKLGRVELTSVTGYNINEFENSSDRTPTYTTFARTNFGVTGAVLSTPGKTDKFTQELRSLVPLGARLELLLGGFYTHEKSRIDQSLFAVDTGTGATAGNLLTAATPRAYKEYAGFADLTVRVTDRFDVQFGGRESEIRQDFSQTSVGPLAGAGGVSVTPERSSKANVFTYLVTPKLQISPHLMTYARFASGYRPGVANITLNTAIPASSNPDRTRNYELGAKAQFLGGALSLDTSLYYIDWTDIQLLLVNPVNRFSYQTNGSRAKSQGIELAIAAQPRAGTTIDAWFVFNDAVLTEDIPTSNSARGLSGDRLPNSSRVSGSLSLQQDFPIRGDMTGFVRGAVSYIGDNEGVFTQTTTRQHFGGYAKADLSAGVRYDSWALDLFANNIADRRGAVGGGIGTTPPFAFSYIQPRTIGLTVSKSF